MRRLWTSSVAVSLLSLAGCAPNFDPPLADGPLPVTSAGGSKTQALVAPPISGGTLAVSPDGKWVVVADADNDEIDLVSLRSAGQGGTYVVAKNTLDEGDEPGRATFDAQGRVHVVLRGTGELLSFPIGDPMQVTRRPACAEARGVTANPVGDRVYVACATGKIVAFNPSGGSAPVSTFDVEPDLRDVVFSNGSLFASKFRSAELLQLDLQGNIVARATPPSVMRPKSDGTPAAFTPGVAWRMTTDEQGRIVMVHQLGQTTPIDLSGADAPAQPDTSTAPSPYGGDPSVPCSGILNAAVSTFDGHAFTTASFGVTLPVDVAPGPAGTVSIAAAGSRQIVSNVALGGLPGACFSTTGQLIDVGEPVAVAATPMGLVTQLRNPARLLTPFGSVALNNTKFLDPGHMMFHHAATGGGTLACASCHPEGTEDGRTWNFSPIGARRTQNLSGGISGTAPFHWDGDLSDMSHLMGEVFVRRMGGAAPDKAHVDAMMQWIDSIRPRAHLEGLDGAAVARGKALFEDADVACSSCHAGDLTTNNESRDVGTGGTFQVPSLRRVAFRTPVMHDGCAATLEARFSPACGGGDLHGHTSQLSAAQISDLVAYLKSL